MRHHALSALGRHDEALAAIDRCLALIPDHRPFRRFRALSLRNAGRYDEAARATADLLRDSPDDPDLLGASCVAAYRRGDEPAAIAFGQRRLDALAAAMLATAGPPPPERPPSSGGAPTVAFGLWGDRRQYAEGAILNARAVPDRLPGWRALFYLGDGVPPVVRAALAEAGATIVEAWRDHPDVPPMAWRFLVHDRADTGRYLVRDTDSRIGPRERAAVAEWEASDQPFHLLRDHPFHHELMVGGVWGGTARQRFSMAERLAAARDSMTFGYGGDQHFLARFVWPWIRDAALTHDSHYALGASRPFPDGSKGDDADHVGMGILLRGICKAAPSG